MEENTNNITDKGQTDRDILQCKADILQAWKSSNPAKPQPPHNSDPAIDISEIPKKTKPPKKTEPLRPVAEKQQPQETIYKPEDLRQNLELTSQERSIGLPSMQVFDCAGLLYGTGRGYLVDKS